MTNNDLPPSSFEEKRAHERTRLIIDVFYDGADATGVAGTNDMSVGGLYMNTQAELPEGSLLTIRIPFAEGDVVVNAEVAYINPGRGVGLSFHGLPAHGREIIERVLARE
ncbi:MAG: PilZ domain-containing protein [Pyrinomonadaceae bacterium]|nr:PilZ domain-containing protein [Pyrinomonadaceae bacterium]MDQ3135158.1 PilZ domain-containing protein [Acidobacteriota bacterium]